MRTLRSLIHMCASVYVCAYVSRCQFKCKLVVRTFDTETQPASLGTFLFAYFIMGVLSMNERKEVYARRTGNLQYYSPSVFVSS